MPARDGRGRRSVSRACWPSRLSSYDRLKVVQRVVECSLSGVDAAQQLGLTARQIGRLVKAYRADGAAGLVSKKRGKPSNRAYSVEFKERVLSIVRRSYVDFGPTLIAEKLLERHQIVSDRRIEATPGSA